MSPAKLLVVLGFALVLLPALSWAATPDSLRVEGRLPDNAPVVSLDQPRGTAGWYKGARHNDTSTSLLWNASSAQLGNYPDRYNVMSAVSYITGSHNVKVGFQDSWGPYKRWNTANADLYQTYQNGNPFQVTVLNTPIDTGEYLDANFGLYAQDSYRINHFTFNYGVRWDRQNPPVSEQIRQARQHGSLRGVIHARLVHDPSRPSMPCASALGIRWLRVSLIGRGPSRTGFSARRCL